MRWLAAWRFGEMNLRRASARTAGGVVGAEWMGRLSEGVILGEILSLPGEIAWRAGKLRVGRAAGEVERRGKSRWFNRLGVIEVYLRGL